AETGKRLAAITVNQLSLLRSPWLHFACAIEYFLLTLTLSLREREQQASGWCFADGYWANSGTGVIVRRWTIILYPGAGLTRHMARAGPGRARVHGHVGPISPL